MWDQWGSSPTVREAFAEQPGSAKISIPQGLSRGGPEGQCSLAGRNILFDVALVTPLCGSIESKNADTHGSRRGLQIFCRSAAVEIDRQPSVQAL
jgi:hypothetical protein